MNDAERVINTCKWRYCGLDIVICKSESIPCALAIDSGKCPTLIEYFKETTLIEIERFKEKEKSIESEDKK